MQKLAFFITSDGWGGLEMSTLRLAGWLNEYGYNINLFSPESSRTYSEAKSLPINLYNIDTPRRSPFTVHCYYAFKIAKLLKSLEIKTLFVFDNRDISIVSVIKRLFYKELKVIYQQHMQIGINKKDIIHTIRYSAIDTWITPLDTR